MEISGGKNRVVLIYPSSEADRMSVIPLSLLYVARPLLEAGVEVEILDQRYDDRFYDRLGSEVDGGPLCVGISCITGPQIVQVAEICRFIRERADIPIVIGGPHPTLVPEQTLESGLFDYAVLGRGEAPFLNLVNALRAGKPAGGLRQVGSREDGGIVVNREAEPEVRTREVPYHLVLKYGRPAVVPIVTSFGCPHRCSFCVEKVFHPRYREVPFEDVLSMLSEALRLQPDLINFLDDNFLANRRKVMELMSVCMRNGVRFKWICTGRVDEVLSMGPGALSLAGSSGLTGIFFGIESGSPRMLRLINKRISPEMVLRVNALLRDSGIMAHYSFMAGFPTETAQDMEMTVRLMKSLKRDNPGAVIWKVNRYTPYPGTPMYDLAVENGFKPPESFEEWSHVHFYAEDYRLPYDIHY